MFSVNSPDWISEKIDSINAAKGNDNALPEGEEDVYTVGATDYSSGFWAAFSKYYVIPEGKTWNAVFNLNINPSAPNTFKNFALILASDDDRGGANYKEYGAIRFDNQPSGNSEWGDYIDRSGVVSDLTLKLIPTKAYRSSVVQSLLQLTAQTLMPSASRLPMVQ